MNLNFVNSDPSQPGETDIFRVKINPDDLQVSNSEIILSLGYSNDEPLNTDKPGNPPPKPDAHVIEMIDNVLSGLTHLCEIQAGYRILDAHKSAERSDGLYIGNKFFNMQKIVTGQLRKSEKAALFVCSIGPGMENKAKKLLLDGEPLLSYVTNTVASVVAEKATDFLHDYISVQMKELGLSITNRYSPGYCDWPVFEQHLLFSLVPEKFCGVTLSESSLMLPIKSVSGVIGIGASVKWKEYICDRCGIKDCTYRSKRRVSVRKKLKTGN